SAAMQVFDGPDGTEIRVQQTCDRIAKARQGLNVRQICILGPDVEHDLAWVGAEPASFQTGTAGKTYLCRSPAQDSVLGRELQRRIGDVRGPGVPMNALGLISCWVSCRLKQRIKIRNLNMSIG